MKNESKEEPVKEIQIEGTELYVDIFEEEERIELNDRTVPKTIKLTFKQAKELAFKIKHYFRKSE